MSSANIKSVFEIANWFFRRADKDDIGLDNAKLQQLMFLAQLHFAISNNHTPLFAGFFIQTPKGIEDPNLSQLLQLGLPLITKSDFEKSTADFLELIWKKYSPLSVLQLDDLIRKSVCKPATQSNSVLAPIDINTVAAEFHNNIKYNADTVQPAPKQKVLISQNGPVVVSQWQPRKVKSTNSKEN